MAWTNLSTSIVVGSTDHVDLHNTIHGSLNDSHQGTKLNLQGNSTITTGTNTTLAFSTGSEARDDGDWHNESTNNDRITVTDEGWYSFGANVSWDNNSTAGFRRVTILLNGATRLVRQALPADANDMDFVLSSIHYMSTGDYLTVEVFQNSGGNVDVLSGGGNVATNFWCHRMA